MNSSFTRIDMPQSIALGRGEPLPDLDFHCPIMSLPLAFKTELSTIPPNVPYLETPLERVEKWRGRVPQVFGAHDRGQNRSEQTDLNSAS